MSHNEERTHWIKEGVIGMGTGILYGLTSVVVGHPFDTVKTKMQAQSGYEKLSTFRTLSKVYKLEGIRGLYRGAIPPLWGSGLYRSIQFSGFEAVYTYMNNPLGNYVIPLTHGLQLKVIFGGIMAGTCRAIIETPLEYAKTHRQTGQNWHFKDTYTGFKITWIRSFFLLPSYFILLDSFRRHFNNVFSSPIVGPFLAGGIASIIAWTATWPLEYIRCQIQAGYLKEKKLTIPQRLNYIVKERGGFLALYRGLGPGLFRSFFANGCAMVVMQYAQKQVSELGWRDTTDHSKVSHEQH